MARAVAWNASSLTAGAAPSSAEEPLGPEREREEEDAERDGRRPGRAVEGRDHALRDAEDEGRDEGAGIEPSPASTAIAKTCPM